MNSNNAKYYYNQANLLFELEPCQAVDFYNKALEIEPNCYEAWYRKGLILYKCQKFEEAVESFDKALQIDSYSSKAWGKRGFSLLNLSKYKEAIESFYRALNNNPEAEAEAEVGDYWYAIGSALYNLEKFKEAVEAYDKALKLEPYHPLFWQGKAEACYHTGELQTLFRELFFSVGITCPKRTSKLGGPNLGQYEI